eukprot:14628468-Alexandrium_andersonii.AAC.1
MFYSDGFLREASLAAASPGQGRHAAAPVATCGRVRAGPGRAVFGVKLRRPPQRQAAQDCGRALPQSHLGPASGEPPAQRRCEHLARPQRYLDTPLGLSLIHI